MSDSASRLRVVMLVGVLLIMLFVAACSSGGSKSHNTTTTSPPVPLPQWASYQRACANEGDVCSGPPSSFSGSLPAELIRPLHLPATAGRRCPSTPGHVLSAPDFPGVWSLQAGPVGVAIDNAGDLRHGTVNLARGPSGWENVKTHFFSVPAYQGPFLVRARRLDRPAPIRLGGGPSQTTPLVVPRGQTPNGTNGWREIPYFTFVKTPGCYGWQIDGLTFSKVIVARMLAPLHG